MCDLDVYEIVMCNLLHIFLGSFLHIGGFFT